MRVRIGVCLLALLTLAGCNSETRKRRFLETGNKYFKNGRYDKASLVYRRAIQLDARYGEAHYRLGLTELKLGQAAAAIRSLRRACELNPGNEEAHVTLGEVHLAFFLANPQTNKQGIVEFGEVADTLLKRNANSYEGLRLKGYHWMSQGKIKEAIESFTAANGVKPDQAGLILMLAQTLTADNRFEEGEKLVLAFQQKDKQFGAAYDFLYRQYLGRNRGAEAEAVLKKKVEANPKTPDYWVQLADHYMRAKQPDQMDSTLARLTGNLKDFPNAHMTVGDYYVRIRDLEKAHLEYARGSEAQPKNKLSFQKKMVEIRFSQGRRDEAIKLAQTLVETHKNDPEVKALRAALRVQSGDRKEIQAAVSELREVVTRIPNNPVIRFRLGEALMSNGDQDQARLQFEESVKLHNAYTPAKLALTHIFTAKGEHAKALQMAGEILAMEPANPAARLLRAGARINLSDRGQGRAELELLLKDNPNLMPAVHMLAMLDLEEKKLAQAESGFRRVLAASPTDQRALQGLVEAQFSQGREREGQQVIEDEIRKAPESLPLRMMLADVARNTKQHDKAIQEYRFVLDKAPNSPQVHSLLGDTYKAVGKLPEALASFQKAIELAPQDAGAHVKLALTFEEMGDPRKARPLYEKVIKLIPDHQIALNNLAYQMAESGENLDLALTYAQRARQKFPQSLDIADTLGWVYIRKNLSDNAITIYRDLVSKNPRHVTWRYHLALALFQKGDKPKARQELETALRNKPTKEEEGKIRDLLLKTGA